MDEINQTISKKYLLATVFLIYVLSFTFIVMSHIYDPPSSGQDETVNYLFSTIYAENGNLLYLNDLNTFGEDIIRPNGVILVNEKFVSMKFIGFPLYCGSYAMIIGTNFIPYFTLIFSIMGIFFIYVLGNQLYGKTNGIMSCFLFLILPYHLYWSFRPLLENIFGSVIFVLGVAYFLKYIQEKNMKYLMLAALFLGTSFNIRPDVVLYFIPLGFILILNLKKIGIRAIMTFMLIGLITTTPILLLNYDLYGGYLSTGQSIIHSKSPDVVGDSTSVLFDKALVNLTNLSSVSPLFALLIIAGIFIAFNKRLNSKLSRVYIFFIISSFIVFTLYYLTGTYPWQGGGLMESYTRYVLPIYLTSVPLLSKGIQNFRHVVSKDNQSNIFGNKFVVLLVTIFITVNLLVVFSTLSNDWDRRDKFEQITITVSENTEPNAVIFISYFDVYVFPKRNVAIINKIQSANKEKAVVDIMVNLSKQNIPLYFYLQNWYSDGKSSISFNFNEFANELHASRFELVLIEKNSVGKLYAIRIHE